MPTNPNMKGEKLKSVFESLGFENVATVIASGNVVFSTRSQSAAALETKIEKALTQQLGFKRAAIVRSLDEIERLVKKNPFKRVAGDESKYPIVTFFKDGRKDVCTVLDRASAGTPEFMRDLEKKYGKELTTRTWKTVGRILRTMGASR